jgi:uncharacterized protein (DUF4213/DUF364 family)
MYLIGKRNTYVAAVLEFGSNKITSDSLPTFDVIILSSSSLKDWTWSYLLDICKR